MFELSRRRVLRGAAGIAVASQAGCVAQPAGVASEPPASTATTSKGGVTEWERSTDCANTPTEIYDSVIRIEAVKDRLPAGYVPIEYSALTDGERAILREVLDQGGYGTCEVSNAFVRFLERVGTHRERQSEAVEEDLHIYLEYEDTYYRLYVERQDQVFAY